jgi:hypothetical protein
MNTQSTENSSTATPTTVTPAVVATPPAVAEPAEVVATDAPEESGVAAEPTEAVESTAIAEPAEVTKLAAQNVEAAAETEPMVEPNIADNTATVESVEPGTLAAPQMMPFNSTRLLWLQFQFHTKALKPTTDMELETAKADLLATYTFATQTLKQTKALDAWMRASPQLTLASSLTQYYQHPAAAQEADTIKMAAAFQQTSEQCDQANTAAYETYMADVVAPVQKWLAEYNELMHVKYPKSRDTQLVSEYYTRKLASLQANAVKIANTPKDTQAAKGRLARNIVKQQQARGIFEQSSKITLAEMKAMNSRRFAAFAPVVGSLSQLQTKRG